MSWNWRTRGYSRIKGGCLGSGTFVVQIVVVVVVLVVEAVAALVA